MRWVLLAFIVAGCVDKPRQTYSQHHAACIESIAPKQRNTAEADAYCTMKAMDMCSPPYPVCLTK